MRARHEAIVARIMRVVNLDMRSRLALALVPADYEEAHGFVEAVEVRLATE